MTVNRVVRAEKYIDSVLNGTVYRISFTELRAAICYVVLGKYNLALDTFDKAVLEMLSDRMWMQSGEPNCIVEAFALSTRSVAPERVQGLVRDFAAEQNSTSPLFHYTMSLAGMLWPGYSNVRHHIQAILDQRHSKYLGAVAKFALNVIDNADVVDSASYLLKSCRAHNPQRYATDPRGYLCVPLMAISAAAGSPVVLPWPSGDMVSKEYLEYQRDNRSSR